jgi:hypothetical protein
VPIIDVDPERLGREAEALTSNRSWLDRGGAELDAGCAMAAGASAGRADGGLADAVRRFSAAWSADIGPAAEQMGSLGSVVAGIARHYQGADQSGASDLNR